jgi:peptidoglycan/xylan/chitin deacetylase (PgdA/CDA1 family)
MWCDPDPMKPEPVARPQGRRRGLLRNRSGGATFLCYHSVADEGRPFTTIAPDTFERHLALLRKRGDRNGTLGELRLIARGDRPRGRHVFLTFDDGYVDNFTIALPLLRAYGFTAMIFILPPYVDSGAATNWSGLEDACARYPDVMRSMTWTMVEAMVEAGFEFGSHTLRHPHLPEVDDEVLMQELVDSRRRITERLGRCDALSYPYGEWSPRVASAAAAAGYSFAFSLPDEAQRGASSMSIPRMTIDHRDEARRFALKLTPTFRRLWFSPARAGFRWLRRGLGPS